MSLINVTNYRGEIARAILGKEILYPLCGMTGSPSRFTAWDNDGLVMVIGMYVDAITPEAVQTVEAWAKEQDDSECDWLGVLITPFNRNITVKTVELCEPIRAFICRMFSDGFGVIEMESAI